MSFDLLRLLSNCTREKGRVMGVPWTESRSSLCPYCTPSGLQTEVPAVVTAKYTSQRENERSVEEGEVLLIISSDGQMALVERGGDEKFYLPISLLAYNDLEGENMAEQIESRRHFLARLDNVAPAKGINPLSSPRKILNESAGIPSVIPMTITHRPIIINALEDVEVKEFSALRLSIQIFCNAAFSVVWRGPAVSSHQATLTAENSVSSLQIDRTLKSYSGFYSIVANSHCGSAISHCLVKIISKPLAPSNLRFKLISQFAIFVTWNAVPSTLYMLEYKREGMNKFRPIHTGISANKISIRGFKLAVYEIRVIAYNKLWRSEPSNVITVDLERLAFAVANGESDEAREGSSPLTRSTAF